MLDRPERIAAHMAPFACGLPVEKFWVLCLNRRNRLLVTEAGTSSVSSYRFGEADPARPILVSASVPDTQGAACWIAITTTSRASAAPSGSNC